MAGVEKLITEHIDVWTSAIKKRNATGRGSNKKIELTGIKKLRELILELAVRGKLVPQDASDEPASVLLEKIAEERSQLSEDKKIKKQKPLPVITDEAKPFELPLGWEWARLQTIIQISSGNGLTSTQMNKSGKVPVYGGNGVTGYHDTPNVNKRTLVIGRVGFYCGSVHLTPEKAWVTDNAFITTFAEKNIDIDYLSWLLKATNLNENDSATAQPVISGRKLYPIVICLPPLAEQYRIVAKVDELMALCDQLEQQTEQSLTAQQTLVEVLLASLTSDISTDDDNKEEFQTSWQRIAEHFDVLFTTEASIEQLKQTILQLAVMGKLVPQNPNDEPASVLLEKIAEEKAQLIADKKIKKQKPLPAITDEETPFELPTGWEWAKLGNALNKITDGTHHSPINGDSGEYLYISAKNIKNNGVQLSNATYITKEMHDEIYSRCDPEYGDILYIKDGATTGIVTINDIDEPFSMLSSVALLKCPAGILNRYLLLSLRSPFFYKEMRAGMSGVAITRVTLKKLNVASFPLPPLAEQHRIVAKVDELMALCEQLKARLADAQTTQLHLADAVVENALT